MLLSHLDLLATARGGVAYLRELILNLAVQGKLVQQDPVDEPASVLLEKIRAEKDRLIAEGKMKRDKPLVVIADEEKPFELPVGWEWVRVGQVASRVQYGVTASADHTQDAPKFVRITDIQNDQVNWDTVPGMQGVTQDFSDHYLKSGDLLVARTGGTIGKSFLVSSVPVKAVFASYLIRISPAPSSDPSYLKIFASSAHYWRQLYAKSMGTGQPNVNGTALSQLTLPLPPLAEQSRIVIRVEELMRLCDALEAKGQLEATQHAQLVSTLLGTLTTSTTPEELADHWQRVAQHFDLLLDRPEAIDALEQTLLQLAVRGLLVPQDPADEPATTLLARIRSEKDRLIAEGKIKRDKPLPPITDEEKPFQLPVGWEWVRASDVVEMLNGYAFKSEWFQGTGVRLLRNLNVSHGHVDWSQSAMLDPVPAKDYEPFALRTGDIVLSLDRPIISTGLKYAVIRDSDLPCLLLQRVARLAPWLGAVSSEFLVLWLQSDLFVSTIDPGRSNGVPHISTKQVGGLVFALPPLAEQSRIVTRVTALRRICADLRQRLKTAQVTQSHLAQALVESSNAL